MRWPLPATKLVQSFITSAFGITPLTDPELCGHCGQVDTNLQGHRFDLRHVLNDVRAAVQNVRFDRSVMGLESGMRLVCT
ncbi:hypothetical protein M413DRAFT_442425 [Hebeloma cylindrosporum]|uniref:Uncharacterized protein n=1 Tax=Hebeloma cylindrosporum TaxID=76867 RepID=A0A0C3CK12_HEBCY|nr:hypothetical protein M413DRAFT_442425 [Hebeloma cylindrosporum h7]